MAVAANRLFFAVRPDAATAERIHALTLRLRELRGFRGKPHAPDRLHVTLLFLGDHDDLPPQLLAAADAAGRSLRHSPFALAFDRLMSFERSRGAAPLVLCRDDDRTQLDELRRQLHADRPLSFKPHVTLLYDRKMIPAEELAPIGWNVTEVLLVRSLIGRSRHEVLGRYPLN